MLTYGMKSQFGVICGDSTKAVFFLNEYLLPSLDEGKSVRLDFTGVRVINSSFSNALFGNLIRTKGRKVLDSMALANMCPIIESEVKSGISLGLKSSNSNNSLALA